MAWTRRRRRKSGFGEEAGPACTPSPGCHRAHRLGSGDFRGENCLGEVTPSETVTGFEENVRFRKSHSGPRSLPNWDIREPIKKRLPPREKLPQLGEVIQWRGARCPPWRRPARGLSGPPLGPGRGRGAGSGGRGCRGGQSTKAGPGAGRALYRGRRLRQEAGGGEGGATQLPGEGGGSAPGGHGAQPAAALTPACAPPASRPRPRPRLCIRGPRRLPPQLPSAPSPRELRRPKLGEKFPNFRQARRSAPARVPRLPAFPLGPQSSAARRPWKPEPSPELPCPLARPSTQFSAWPAGPRGPLPAAATRPGFPPRGGGSS